MSVNWVDGKRRAQNECKWRQQTVFFYLFNQFAPINQLIRPSSLSFYIISIVHAIDTMGETWTELRKHTIDRPSPKILGNSNGNWTLIIVEFDGQMVNHFVLRFSNQTRLNDVTSANQYWPYRMWVWRWTMNERHNAYATFWCVCVCDDSDAVSAHYFMQIFFIHLFSPIYLVALSSHKWCWYVRMDAMQCEEFLFAVNDFFLSLSPHNVKSGAMKCIRRQVAHRQATTRPTKNQFHFEWHILYMRSIAAAAIYWWWNIQRERRWGNSKIKKRRNKT